MSKFWIKTSFWDKVIRSFALLGGGTTAGLSHFGAGDFWVLAAGAFSILGALTALWMVDHDKNGIVDIFEDK